MRVRGLVFTLASGRGQLPHLLHDALAVALSDGTDRNAGVDHPRLEPEARGNEAQRADRGALRQTVVWKDHAVGTHSGVALNVDIALRVRRLDAVGDDRDQ